MQVHGCRGHELLKGREMCCFLPELPHAIAKHIQYSPPDRAQYWGHFFLAPLVDLKCELIGNGEKKYKIVLVHQLRQWEH